MNPKSSPRSEQKGKPASTRIINALSVTLWGVAVVVVILSVAAFVWRPDAILAPTPEPIVLPTSEAGEPESLSGLPAFSTEPILGALFRQADLHTDLLEAQRMNLEEYTVTDGDSLFAIANSYELEPETILWANYDVLADNADYMSVGATLKIPPTDGIWYKWKNGDTPQSVASKYNADVNELLAYPGNHLDMMNPVIEPGTWIMIPGGSRETVSWVVATVATGKAGVTVTISGPGSCDANSGLGGSGYFIWPTTGAHAVSGNEYWSGHLGIDIAAYTGDQILAADSGTVTYAGWNTTGYGNMVMIDHLNGYATLYAHLSKINVSCGSSVNRGAIIGYAGSTGNSTGPHLHFEIRYYSSFVNPWSLLN